MSNCGRGCKGLSTSLELRDFKIKERLDEINHQWGGARRP